MAKRARSGASSSKMQPRKGDNRRDRSRSRDEADRDAPFHPERVIVVNALPDPVPSDRTLEEIFSYHGPILSTQTYFAPNQTGKWAITKYITYKDKNSATSAVRKCAKITCTGRDQWINDLEVGHASGSSLPPGYIVARDEVDRRHDIWPPSRRDRDVSPHRRYDRGISRSRSRSPRRRDDSPRPTPSDRNYYNTTGRRRYVSRSRSPHRRAISPSSSRAPQAARGRSPLPPRPQSPKRNDPPPTAEIISLRSKLANAAAQISTLQTSLHDARADAKKATELVDNLRVDLDDANEELTRERARANFESPCSSASTLPPRSYNPHPTAKPNVGAHDKDKHPISPDLGDIVTARRQRQQDNELAELRVKYQASEHTQKVLQAENARLQGDNARLNLVPELVKACLVLEQAGRSALCMGKRG